MTSGKQFGNQILAACPKQVAADVALNKYCRFATGPWSEYFLLQFCHQGAPKRAGGGLSGIRRVPVLQHASLEEERTRDLRTVPGLF